MPDSKITALTSTGTGTDPAVDPLVIVDVSDTTMAATGTTKKVTLNQLLACSPTATLASATITGDLTVSTAARFNGGALAAYLNGSLLLGSSGNYVNIYGQSNGLIVKDNTGVQNLFSIATAGVFTFGDGAGGTRMTLNSTGLGVGIVPSSFGRFSVQGTAVSAGILGMNTDATRSDIQSYNVPLALNRAGNNITMCEGGGNVGIGVTPSAWNSNYNALDIGQNGTISGRAGSSNTVDLASNGFRNTSGNWVYKLATSNTACRYQLDGSTGSHIWYSGAAGTAGNTIAGFSSALMTLDASGNLILQPPSSPPTLGTNGQLTVNATSNTNLRFSYRGSDGVTRVANITLA